MIFIFASWPASKRAQGSGVRIVGFGDCELELYQAIVSRRGDTGRTNQDNSSGGAERQQRLQVATKIAVHILERWNAIGSKGCALPVASVAQTPPAGDVELWLIGQMALPKRLLADLPGKVVIRASVPREELMEIYGRASVLVFPSLCEGFGMVITEAMANGLPVITTNNTGGPAFIQHGRNGFLIPIRDADCLAETMQWCLDRRLDLVEISARASESAAKWQWRDYRAALGNTLAQLLVKSNQVAGEDSALFKTAG